MHGDFGIILIALCILGLYSSVAEEDKWLAKDRKYNSSEEKNLLGEDQY